MHERGYINLAIPDLDRLKDKLCITIRNSHSARRKHIEKVKDMEGLCLLNMWSMTKRRHPIK